MKRMIVAVLLGIFIGCGGQDTPSGAEAVAPAQKKVHEKMVSAWQHSGAPFTLKEITAAKTLLADPSAFVGQDLRVKAVAADVCQKKGCWLVIAHEEKTMRVMMKDHAFGIASDSSGAQVDIEGQIVEVAPDPKAAAHFAGEAKKPSLTPEGEGLRKTYQLIATAISVLPQG